VVMKATSGRSAEYLAHAVARGGMSGQRARRASTVSCQGGLALSVAI
jgi:hypothetical protein